jgi:hypothetical protein
VCEIVLCLTRLVLVEGVAISLDNPEDVGRLEANQDMLAQKLAAARKPSNREDMSDMVAEHQASMLRALSAQRLH